MNTSRTMKLKRTLIAIVTCIAFVLVSLAGLTLLRTVEVAHADTTGNWTDTGNFNMSWYNENDTTFTLSTASEFAGLAYLVNNGNSFSGKTIKLGNDIDLSGTAYNPDGLLWTPIGTSSRTFKGTFDGQGHTISNMTVNTNVNYSHSGLFGSVDSANIRNVTLNNCSVTSTANYGAVGGIVGSVHDSLIENVTNNGTITGSGNGEVGGIVGYASIASIINATNNGTIMGSGNGEVGGILGTTNADCWVKIVNCYNAGTIIGDEYNGGILGYLSVGAGADIVNCCNVGMITGNGCNGGIIGNIVGKSPDITMVLNCYNRGKITGNSCNGGIIGQFTSTMDETFILNCYNLGEITGNGCNGGIIGESISKRLTLSSVYYLNNIDKAVGSGTCMGEATPMSETDMKGAIDAPDSLAYALNDYVYDNDNYRGYALKNWVVVNGDYPTINLSLTGITVEYNGGDVARGNKIDSDNILITATYIDSDSNESNVTITGGYKYLTYLIDGETIDITTHRFLYNVGSRIAITVEYGGYNVAINITVGAPIVTGITATYNGEIPKGNKVESDKIVITATYSDDSTGTISANDVTYWLEDEQNENFLTDYRFNTMGTIAVTVKYSGQETVMNINVVEPIITGINATYINTAVTVTKYSGQEAVMSLTAADSSAPQSAFASETATSEESDGGSSFWKTFVEVITGILFLSLIVFGVIGRVRIISR